jgi:YHS domain-containing protein
MKFPKTVLAFSIVTTIAIITFVGCCQQCSTTPEAPSATATAIPPELIEFKETIQKLPEDEWAAVYKQKICPVSGGALGAMGTPIKVAVEGRDVYICCEGCRKSLEADPEKYLSKIPK